MSSRRRDGELSAKDLETQAQQVERDQRFGQILLSCIKETVAWGIFHAIVLLALGPGRVVTSQVDGPLSFAVIIAAADYVKSVVADQLAPPSLEYYAMAPFFTLCRAPAGHRCVMFTKELVFSIIRIMLALGMAFVMQSAISAAAPGVDLTIPTLVVQTNTIYIFAFVMCVAALQFIVLFITVGAGHSDGAYLPKQLSQQSRKRIWREWNAHAVISGGMFLFLFIVAGQSFPIDFFYLFATWTQKKLTTGTDYPMLFGWYIATAVLCIFVYEASILIGLLLDSSLVRQCFRLAKKGKRLYRYDSDDEGGSRKKKNESTDTTDEDEDDGDGE